MDNLQESKKCKLCGHTPKRSLPQNARLHKLFMLMSENFKGKDGLYHPHQWWKVMCKDRWLGYNEYVGANGTIYALKSTAELTVEELNEFMNEVEKFCAERSVWLQE